MSELKAGALLYGGKYRIEKSLGQGGFGITYLAEQTNLGRKVCIKEFFMKEYGERTASPQIDSEETVITGGVPSSRPKDVDATVLTGVSAVTSAAAEIMGKYREKFVKEARTIARLDHPGIVRIHDVFEENGTAYYVMDFIEGENLNDMVKREGPLPEGRALGYIRQVADALSYVHDHKIMHLDVKPANFLVRKSDDKAILIDFGTAKQYDSEGTQTSTTPVGLSVGYAPIEMTKPGGVQTFSPETDVYSLGATLYYLVTGQNPPDASERMEMIMEGEKFKLPGNVSSATADVIEQSMQARKKRVQTVNGFMDLLNSDGEKKRIEAEEKTAKEAEAKRQEALRIEREKEEAEKKRIAEEKAREEAETKRQKQEKDTAEKKRLAEEKRKETVTNNWLIAINVVFFIAGIVMFLIACTTWGWGVPTFFDPFGYVGFGLLCASVILSIICLSRKSASIFNVIVLICSLVIGFVCLFDAIEEDYLSNPYGYDNYYEDITLSHSLGSNSVTFSFPDKVSMPKAVYLKEDNNFSSTINTSTDEISTVNNNEYYYNIDYSSSQLTIYNLKLGTTYRILFDPKESQPVVYGILGTFCNFFTPTIKQFHITPYYYTEYNNEPLVFDLF